MHANNKRLRSACTSVQSDQRLCYSRSGNYSSQACFVHKSKILASLYSWTDWFEREILTFMHTNNKRRRSACTSVQSDQRLCYSLPGKYSSQAFQYTCKSDPPKPGFLATGPRCPCLSLQLFTFFQWRTVDWLQILFGAGLALVLTERIFHSSNIGFYWKCLGPREIVWTAVT